jgi:hypothetical protein
LPEKDKHPETSAIFGLSAGACYARYDPEQHCLKTCQDYLFPMEGGFSTELCLTFTSAGMMRNGRLYPLRRSGQSILGKECGLSAAQETRGLWRTPDANMERGNRSYEKMKMRIEQGKPLNLNDQLNAIKFGLIGTPVHPAPPGSSGLPNSSNKAGNNKTFFLTPRATDTGEGEKQRTFIKRMGDRTDACFQSLPAQVGGLLNADWVEALMGYPQSWTDIEKDCSFENRCPEAWLTGEWEQGTPRTAAGRENRVDRLKCLGNAVVPQIPMMIFSLPVFDAFRKGASL